LTTYQAGQLTHPDTMSEKPYDYNMYLENLDEWIYEENKVVTYKYLSRALKCHVNVSKQMLFNFLDNQKDDKLSCLGVVYLVSGFCDTSDGDTTMKVCLVKQGDLDKVTAKFSTVTSKHIYSIQKTKEMSPTALYAADREAFKEDVFSGNAHNAIRNKLALPRTKEEIRKAPAPVAVVKQEVKKEPVKQEESSGSKLKAKGKSAIESAFSKTATAKKQSSEANQNSQEKKEPSSKGKPSKEKQKNSSEKKPSHIANFFAKQSKPLVEKKKESISEEPKEKLSPETSPGKENIVNQQREETSKGEVDSTSLIESPKDTKPEEPKTEAVKKATQKKKSGKNVDKSKKRKRIQVMSDSEDEKEESEAEEVEDVREVEEAPPQAALIESDDEIIPPTPKEETKKPGGRRRVKKLVDKTFMDDQGYMVTKKVYESGSESDNEPSPVKKLVVAKVSPTSAPAAKKPKIIAGGTNKQQNIMSFFKKK